MNGVAPNAPSSEEVPHFEPALPAGDLWIFGYGSLMWDPGFSFLRSCPALVRGYHRRICIYSRRWRGTPERPGLVLGLDRGGACHGMAFLVAADRVAATLAELWQREMTSRVYIPRLVKARLPHAIVEALAFVADRRHHNYAGRLTLEEMARLVASCSGVRGPNLDYLLRTINHLAGLGVEDPRLLRVLTAAQALRVKLAG
jgi:glutathione-specific gamma-glutamylcyclotransferase